MGGEECEKFYFRKVLRLAAPGAQHRRSDPGGTRAPRADDRTTDPAVADRVGDTIRDDAPTIARASTRVGAPGASSSRNKTIVPDLKWRCS